jgi:hypothetical protein
MGDHPEKCRKKAMSEVSFGITQGNDNYQIADHANDKNCLSRSAIFGIRANRGGTVKRVEPAKIINHSPLV